MMSAFHLLWIVPVCVLGGFMWAALLVASEVSVDDYEHEDIYEYDDGLDLDD